VASWKLISRPGAYLAGRESSRPASCRQRKKKTSVPILEEKERRNVSTSLGKKSRRRRRRPRQLSKDASRDQKESSAIEEKLAVRMYMLNGGAM